MKYIIIILILFSFSFCFAAEDKNSVMRMEGNRGLVTYDLIGEPNEDAEVSFSIEYNGKRYSQDELSISGDVGKVISGRNKKIYWDVLKDFPKGLVGDVDWFLDVGGKVYKDPVTGMEFVFVKGGCYDYSLFDQKYSQDKNYCVDDFYIGKYEVTVGDFRKFIKETGYKTIAETNGIEIFNENFNPEDENPKDMYKIDWTRNWQKTGFKQTDLNPVVYLTWEDMQAFISWMNSKSNKSYRLPAYGEWLYAAKPWSYKNSKSKKLTNSIAWYRDNSSGQTHQVGQKESNSYGIYDLYGNVFETVGVKLSVRENNNQYKGESLVQLSGGSFLTEQDELLNNNVGYIYSSYPGGPTRSTGFRILMPVKNKQSSNPLKSMSFKLIKGGCFTMGENDGNPDTSPAHKVCVDNFYMGTYEVTIGQFRKFVDSTGYKTEAEYGEGCLSLYEQVFTKYQSIIKVPEMTWKATSFYQDDYQPVVCVCKKDVNEFIKWANENSSEKYRLPTEAEWEYAAKANGNYTYSGSNDFNRVAWFAENSENTIHSVGLKAPNNFGLFDMSGNVFEWVEDTYDENGYSKHSTNNPLINVAGDKSVIRGGAWLLSANSINNNKRIGYWSNSRMTGLGFRLVKVAK